MKKKICIISTIVLLAAVVLAGVLVRGDRFSLEINGNKIDKEEFLDAVSRRRYEVTAYFTGKEGGGTDAGFWEREIDGEIPYRKLADAAVEELKYFHAVYGLAREKGYVEDDSYASFLKRWESENALRKEKIEKGETVYGLSEYTKELYLEYETDTIQKSYCQDLKNEGMEVTEEDRELYYEEHRESYEREDDRTLDYIKIPWEEEGMSGRQAEEYKKILTSIYKKMDEEHSLSELAAENAEISPYLFHAEVAASELSAYSRSINDVLSFAWELKKGESTAILEENGCLYLIECTERKENAPASMEEVKDHINKTLRESRYDEIIAKRAAGAAVECDMERIYFFLKKHINE